MSDIKTKNIDGYELLLISIPTYLTHCSSDNFYACFVWQNNRPEFFEYMTMQHFKDDGYLKYKLNNPSAISLFKK